MPLLDAAMLDAMQARTERRVKGCQSSWDEAGVVSFQVLQSLRGGHGRETVLAGMSVDPEINGVVSKGR
jgi:hypothetical protein